MEYGRLWDGKQVKHCIYAYVNKHNGKVYVGKAEKMATRHTAHLNRARKHPTMLIDKAIANEGIDAFDIYIVEEVPIPKRKEVHKWGDSSLYSREFYWTHTFEAYTKGYNEKLEWIPDEYKGMFPEIETCLVKKEVTMNKKHRKKFLVDALFERPEVFEYAKNLTIQEIRDYADKAFEDKNDIPTIGEVEDDFIKWCKEQRSTML